MQHPMNEDWERIYLQEQIFMAEELAQLEKEFYLYLLDQEAKIIKDDNYKETEGTTADGIGHELPNCIIVDNGQTGFDGHSGNGSNTENPSSSREERNNS